MIPLLDLKAQYRSIKKEIDEAIQGVLATQHFIMGSEVKEFEEEVRNHIGANHAFGCASGSDALLLALMAIDIKPGDYVITSPFTFFATAGAIDRLGAIPVFVDIEPGSYNIDPHKVREFLEGKSPLSNRLKAPIDKIKAIIPVHLYGQMADMDRIMEIAQEFDLRVIEDAAQSIGALYKGMQAGTIGDFGCFSFFPSKNLGAFGDAGLITVKDEELAEKTNILRLHGAKPKYHHKYVGINSRLDSIQAAVLRVKLKYLEQWSDSRREIALKYNQLFADRGLVSKSFKVCDGGCAIDSSECSAFDEESLILPVETTGAPDMSGKHIYHQYTIRSNKRDFLEERLKSSNIGSAIYYPVPLHIQECFRHLGYEKEDCPIAICASNQVLSLPIYPELKDHQLEEVVDVVNSALTAF